MLKFSLGRLPKYTVPENRCSSGKQQLFVGQGVLIRWARCRNSLVGAFSYIRHDVRIRNVTVWQ